MTTQTPEDAQQVSLSSPEFWELPLADRDRAFDLLRRELPVSWQEPPVAFAPRNTEPPRGYWAVTRYEDIRQVHTDWETFSAAKGTFLFDNLSREDEYAAAGLMGMDPPQHTLLRDLVQKTFTRRTLARSEKRIQQRARELVAAVAPLGTCDYREIVDPLPHLTVCDLLGFPDELRDEVARLVHVVTAASGPNGFQDSLAGSRELARLAVEVAREREIRPQDDLISALVQSEVDGKRFTDEDLGAMVHLLIVAGADTTAGSLHAAILALDDFPEQKQLLVEDFDSHRDTAVEEVLRWATPGGYIRRVANVDTEVGGRPIAAGDNLVLWFRSGNRDEAAFDDPYRFDVTRNPNQHLSFGGGGIHFCLGNALARMELRAMLRTLVTELPDLHVTSKIGWLPTPQYALVAGPMMCEFTPRQIDLTGGKE
ncbi:cytochrome P450 [Streptomyces sp. BH106]|uniref:cytochrome P450 n=1 Tax=Streptomyces sp. BH106 TaxID=3410409 RepID=UPI003CE999F0